MERSDAHLEETLAELNDRVNDLEGRDEGEALLEAYVNRGSVLAMLGYWTSSAEDMESAGEILESIERAGGRADAGTFVKIQVSLGSMEFRSGGDPVERYFAASERLSELNGGSRHYDQRGIVSMCIQVCGELLDCDHPEYCEPFVNKGLSLLGRDAWSRNRAFDLIVLGAEASDAMDQVDEVMERLSDAIDEGTRMMEEGLLDDVEKIVSALVFRASTESSMGLDDNAIFDMTAATEICEGLLSEHSISDTEVLIDLHHDLAEMLMKADRVEEAEKHMIRAMEIGIGMGAGSSADDRDA